MGNTMQFDFFYGVEAEMFSFYRIPRMLVKDERFRGLSSDAKLLYGLMLDRMSLSIKNGWLDEKNRAYIIYTVDNIAEDLGCSKPTCTKIMRELDSVNGIGLIEKKRRGLGRPDIIYVKNFNVKEQKSLVSGDKRIESQEIKDFNFKEEKSLAFGNKKNESQEIKDFNIQKQNSLAAGNKKSNGQEINNLFSSYNNKNYNNQSYTDMSHIHPINLQENGSVGEEGHPKIERAMCIVDERNKVDDVNRYIKYIRNNLAYDYYVEHAGYKEKELFLEIYETVCDVVCVRRKTLRINGEEYPYELVKSRFMKLNNRHVEYVMDCMQKSVTKVTNIRAYLITALYNAPTTMLHYYQQEVQHDMYGGG